MSPAVEKLVTGSARMPTLPFVYAKIKSAVEDPDSSFDDIARVVASDQALSASLLRLANSAFYGYPSAVSSIPEALSVIGLQQFKNMALSTCIVDVFRGIPPELARMEAFWSKSLACGLCARIIALALREPNSERFFLGGLMCKIGRLVIFGQEPEKALRILELSRAREEPMDAIEREILGFDHAEAGSALLEHWNLPASVCEIVRYYHKPALAKLSPRDVSIAHIADFITEALGLGNAGDALLPDFSDAAWKHSGLDESRLYYVVEELQRQYAEVRSVFIKS